MGARPIERTPATDSRRSLVSIDLDLYLSPRHGSKVIKFKNRKILHGRVRHRCKDLLDSGTMTKLYPRLLLTTMKMVMMTMTMGVAAAMMGAAAAAVTA